MKTLTKANVKAALKAVGIAEESVEITGSGKSLQVELKNTRDANKVARQMGAKHAGGYKTGYGSFVYVVNGYKPRSEYSLIAD